MRLRFATAEGDVVIIQVSKLGIHEGVHMQEWRTPRNAEHNLPCRHGSNTNISNFGAREDDTRGEQGSPEWKVIDIVSCHDREHIIPPRVRRSWQWIKLSAEDL